MSIDEADIESAIQAGHPGWRVKAWREERGWTVDQLASKSGADKASISKIEGRTTFGRSTTLAKLALAFGREFHDLFAEPATSSTGSLHIPVDAALVAGVVRDHTIATGDRRDGKAPREELVQVEGAGEAWRALRVEQRASVELDGGAVQVDLWPGDIIVLVPESERAPVHGSLVVAEKRYASVMAAAADIGDDGVQVGRELRVYRELDGQVWLWPLEGEGQPADPARLVAPWRVVEVAVQQRRVLG